MQDDTLHRHAQKGVTLVDVLIGIFGIGIVLTCILTIIFQTFQFNQDNINRDQMVQLGRAVMEDLKTKMLNYQSANTNFIYYSNHQSNSFQSTLCRETDMYFCDDNSSPLLDLNDFTKLAQSATCTSNGTNAETVTGSKILYFTPKAHLNWKYTVQIDALIPPATAIANYANNSKSIPLCKYVRKFKVTVTPPPGHIQAPFTLEAYFPIPS